MQRQKAVKDKKKKFLNPVDTPMAGMKDMPDIFRRYRKSDSKLRKPPVPVPVLPLQPAALNDAPSGRIMVNWLGHTSILLEMGGRRYLLDPVLSERASMFQNIGPKRMHPAPIAIKDLKNIDAVVLSHDHYDHMDYHVMRHLISQNTRFIVPLEVGKILIKWGAKPQQVHELNWWDSITDGPNTIVAVPARHFSGRGIFNRNQTLWASWCFINDAQRLYFGGDSGIMPQYKDIGEAYGPFDVTLMPIGAYDEAWHNIHIFPHEAAEAHVELRGGKMIPVHWATFDLSLHPWSEPGDLLLEHAEKLGIQLLTPMIGEKIDPETYEGDVWWKGRRS